MGLLSGSTVRQVNENNLFFETLLQDVGSGQGHLSRLLSFHYDLPVISLEHEQSFVKKARIYDEEVKLRWKKLSSKVRTVLATNLSNIWKSLSPCT